MSLPKLQVETDLENGLMLLISMLVCVRVFLGHHVICFSTLALVHTLAADDHAATLDAISP